MARVLATLKAVATRAVFGGHGLLAIWQVTVFKRDPRFWYLCAPIIMLAFEGVFTLTIKESQEWKWFCPSVFLYLAGTVPSIWLLELHRMARRQQAPALNISAIAVGDLDKLFGVKLTLPEVDADLWVTLIEQCLMLALILGRWMLPKGDLTRDQLSQLLLVYIGTAADIIEFFDSFKDEAISRDPVLVLLTLAIWSWSLLQFTVVLTATKSRKSRLATTVTAAPASPDLRGGCCSVDVWGIALNMLLQDAPFLVFRLLLILHYRIISYMNVFFTCKNTLVILLQLYRLYVVRAEAAAAAKATRRARLRAALARKVLREDGESASSDESTASSTNSSSSGGGSDVEAGGVALSACAGRRGSQIAVVDAASGSATACTGRRTRAPSRRCRRHDTGYSTASSSVRESSASAPASGSRRATSVDSEQSKKRGKSKTKSRSTMTESRGSRGRRRGAAGAVKSVASDAEVARVLLEEGARA
ncbi:transmembrane protein 26 isoform X2 [Schistocerca gregaria]|uniref:transmembrane protein 26 isoform X2 n=1 Tax=Schistocerca gregaria TaxID=7010 RepID=UPI00211E84EA|nr:transmembrane protein 26 isoform X2 [Schistocerca gregaria]